MLDSNDTPTRAPALLLLLGMIIGLCVAKETAAPILLSFLAAAFLASLSLLQATGRPRIWWLSFLSAAILAFWSYGTLRLPHKPEPQILDRPEREARITFEVERILQAETHFGKATAIARMITAQPPYWEPSTRIYVRLTLPEDESIQLIRGIQLGATGVLSAIPDQVEPDSFESYLKSTGIHYRFERTSLLQKVGPASRFDRFCHQMNHRFESYLRLGAPDGHSLDHIYIAMLLGRKAELDEAQKDRFQMTGTMHFFAISGLHIGVIATVIAQFLILLRVPRKLSPFIGLPLLYLYVEITGASPSAVRAFLMALFFWASFAFSRQRSPLAALAASAVFVLLFKPDQVWSIGFQLSYTVVLSILLFGLPLYRISSQRLAPFRYLPKSSWAPAQHFYARAQDALLLLFAISLSAWLASAPLSAGFFGFVSPGAILLNMLLVNLAALAICSGVIALSTGLIGFEPMTEWINHAAWVCIDLMEHLVIWSSQVPGAIFACEGFPQWIAYAALIIYFSLLFWLQRIQNSAHLALWSLPPAAILGALCVGLLEHF